MKQLAKDYRDFPMFSASSNIINSLSLGLPVLLLTYFYGVAISGAYAFAMRVLSKPMSFIINSMRPVLFQKAAEVHNDGRRLTPLFVKITLGLFALALIPSLVIFIWAPQLFTWVFGSQWHIAGEFSQSLILWMMFMFCNLPAVIFALIIRIQDKLFVFDLILLSARAIVLFGGVSISLLLALFYLFHFLGSL